jgi:hypothetical protein
MRRRAGLTEEHVYPDWLRKLGFGGDGLREIVFNGDPTRTVRQRGGPFSKTLKILCATCNGKWMSGMEQDAKHILIDMFTARTPVALDDAKQLILSRWAFKTVAVLSRIARTRSFPTAHCRDFYANDAPPVQCAAGWAPPRSPGTTLVTNWPSHASSPGWMK